MTPLQANTPQTVLDLLFPPGEDGSVAVVPDLLPPGASEDLKRALANIPTALRTAAVRETTGAAEGLLNADLIGFSWYRGGRNTVRSSPPPGAPRPLRASSNSSTWLRTRSR